jgi:alanyl-tRNA synthetase
MSTSRLYYKEPYRTTFDAVVASCDTIDARTQVVLDQTAFYPTSGGQPYDVGVLGAAHVLDVLDREDGEIVHVVDQPLLPGSTVSGTIDWTRRFDHMQQHTGQHVLSAAFDRLFSARTESFHLGTVSATIDLGREVTAAQIAAAEDDANRIVWEDRPVSIRFATPEEAAAMPLRKEPARTGPLRLIDIEEYDLSACGGTHVARTGAIGIIAIGSAEKFRSGTRVEFLCGGRALARFRSWRDAFAATQRHLSVSPPELAAGVERLQGESKTLQRAIRGLQEQLATHKAAELIARGRHTGDRLVIVEALDGWDAAGLKSLAAAAAAREPRAAVALFSTTSPALAVVAKGKDAPIDAAAVLKQLVAKFGGKGGGKPDLAQGGGLVGVTEELTHVAVALVSE